MNMKQALFSVGETVIYDGLYSSYQNKMAVVLNVFCWPDKVHYTVDFGHGVWYADEVELSRPSQGGTNG